MDKILRDGFLQQASISARGGNNRVRFFVSAAYREEESILVGSDYDRLSTRFNVENKATDRLELGLRFALNVSNNRYTTASDNQFGGFGTAQSRSLPIYPASYSAANIEPTALCDYRFF